MDHAARRSMEIEKKRGKPLFASLQLDTGTW
jgi:hypothetical protein